MNKIYDALREEWVGKQFVYESKYGSETKGVVKDVVVANEMISNKFLTLKESEEMFNWIGTRPVFNIISTNDNVYLLDEIYFLS